ncbi:hexokinase-domain-containing protein [Dichotomocladium elegans]|nr:hexokinase-domain-containing protein [Dichotomocladium elegans]
MANLTYTGSPVEHKYTIDGSKAQNIAVNKLAKEFEITTEQLKLITEQLVREMRKGLDRIGATVPMIPSYVTGRPTGKETGKYLALDLGGTNLRVCLVELLGNGEYTIEQEKFKVQDQYKTGEMSELCDFIAECVESFVDHHAQGETDLQLGFTFSFPVLQTAINRGTLTQWTKGFSCTNAVNEDVTILLQEAFDRRGVSVNIAALVNDTVGTLMAHAYQHPDTTMGVIMGTGTNACYYEKIENITKWDGRTEAGEMVINMEWGAFDCERAVLPLTVYDNKLNRESRNVHMQLYEKMISGMYLGEIARNIMVAFVDDYLLFEGDSSSLMNTQWGFDTAYLTAIEDDISEDLAATKEILEETMGIPSTTLADRQVVKLICEFVGRRAARLAACGLAGVLTHCGYLQQTLERDCIIAVDGSLFEKYPSFESNIRQAMVELYSPDLVSKIKLAHAKDGSGLGAAIIAMIAHKSAGL